MAKLNSSDFQKTKKKSIIAKVQGTRYIILSFLTKSSRVEFFAVRTSLDDGKVYFSFTYTRTFLIFLSYFEYHRTFSKIRHKKKKKNLVDANFRHWVTKKIRFTEPISSLFFGSTHKKRKKIHDDDEKKWKTKWSSTEAKKFPEFCRVTLEYIARITRAVLHGTVR